MANRSLVTRPGRTHPKKPHQSLGRVGQAAASPDRGDRDQDPAAFGELDGIAGKVQQDLTQATLIGMDAAEIRRCRPGDFEALFRGAGGHEFADRAQQVFDIHRGGMKLHLIGAQLGKAQHLVDQAQQVLARGAQGRDIVLLLRGQAGAFQQPEDRRSAK